VTRSPGVIWWGVLLRKGVGHERKGCEKGGREGVWGPTVMSLMRGVE